VLKDKVVLITGASSGFGEAAARLFAREGCRVVLAARRIERLNLLAEEIRAEGGIALPVRLDVIDQTQIDALVAVILKEYGRIDILFNNAGFGRLDWLENLDPLKDIDTQINVNLRGLIQVTRAVLPHMEEQRSGTIINMSSVAGRLAAPLYTVYAATKFGVRGFTEALRREVKPFGIQVCAIYPGGAATEFSQHSGNSNFKRRVKTPEWLRMTSVFVAKKVVALAKHPRRSLVVPWWMRPVIWLNAHLPWLVDLAMGGMVRKYH
jgi:NADP-dependent 3-hydroxy acid dehydrogenase YdfG